MTKESGFTSFRIAPSAAMTEEELALEEKRHLNEGQFEGLPLDAQPAPSDVGFKTPIGKPLRADPELEARIEALGNAPLDVIFAEISTWLEEQILKEQRQALLSYRQRGEDMELIEVTLHEQAAH